MAASGIMLHTYPGPGRATKVHIAAAYGGVTVPTDPKFEMGVTNKTPEFLALNPNGKVPVLTTPAGPVWESNAIMVYVARTGSAAAQLLGSTPYEEAVVRQWMDWNMGELELPLSAIIYQIHGWIPYNPEGTEKATADLYACLEILNTYLTTRTYLVHERVSLADIAVFATLGSAFSLLLDDKLRKKYFNVTRWFETVGNQPTVLAVTGAKPTLAAKITVASPDAYKPPAAAAAKDDKKKAKEAAEDDDEPKEEKKESPLDKLPPSTMEMDGFKKLYSNNDIRKVVLPQLWKDFDPSPNGFSFVFCDYKYDAELKKAFMASNLVTGFFQRTPKNMHKHGFASILVMGNEKTGLSIRGVWLFRGPDVPAEMVEDCEDYPHWVWTKADINDPAQKAKIEDYLAWDGASLWGPLIDGKNFK